jgi:hypothetical protein
MRQAVSGWTGLYTRPQLKALPLQKSLNQDPQRDSNTRLSTRVVQEGFEAEKIVSLRWKVASLTHFPIRSVNELPPVPQFLQSKSRLEFRA